MRINKFVALATGLSRRRADQAVTEGKVTINGHLAQIGETVSTSDKVTLDKQPITPPVKPVTIMLNKPVGYICSRDGQGGKTVYELLPAEFHALKPVGRLDKDSSGLLLLTNDGELANRLTHPRYQKTKIYEVSLDKALTAADQAIITGDGVALDDGPSRLQLEVLDSKGHSWRVTMQEGRNRQIRRTFGALGYSVKALHRTGFGEYELGQLGSGNYREV